MKKLGTIAMVLLILSGCVKDITDTIDKINRTNKIKWDPEIAVPLVYSHLKPFEEARDYDFIHLMPDGTVALYYNDTIYSKTAEEAIVLDNQSFSEVIELNSAQLALLSSNGELVLNFSKEIAFDYQGNEVDRVWLKSGALDLFLTSTLKHNVSLQIDAMEVTHSGTPFTESLSANYMGITPVESAKNIDLSNYWLDMTQSTQGHSELSIDFKLTITKQGNNTMGPTETITLNMDVVDQRFKELYGYFNSLNLTADGANVKVDVYSTENAGKFTIADPRIKLIFGNSMGIAINANITQFDGISEANNTVSLTGYPSPLPIPVPSFSQKGTMVYDSFTLNKDNSNLPTYINNLPINNVVNATIATNPGPSTQRNWFIDTSGIQVEAEIILPLHGTARDFVLETEQPFDLGLEEERVDEVLIRLYTENGLPLDAQVQVYFEDSLTNTVLDSLLHTDRLILPSGTINGLGEVIAVNPKTTDVLFDRARIDLVNQANRVRMKTWLNSTFVSGNQPDVRIQAKDEILLQLGIQAKIKLEEKL